jgi:shikimate dehydrogenase
MPEHYSFGLVGYPVGHSLSPRIHLAAMQELQLAGEYRLCPVEQPSGLQDILDEMRLGNVHGLNVTIPYKNDILPLLDGLTPPAQAIGAANTVFTKNGQLVGDNTDAKGFLADLERLGWSHINGEDGFALILGAGGSARAVVYALSHSGWGITIAARRREQASALANLIRESFSDHTVSMKQNRLSAITLDKESLSLLEPNPSLIINTTPVGMYPQVDASPWPEGLAFPSQAAVYDLVYNPAETILMQSARNHGLQVRNGIGMLVEQAALSLEIWTGLTAPRQAMHQVVMEYSIGA